MAKQLPPGFQNTDFTQYNSWPDVIIDGLPYKAIPGNDQYVFDPYDGAYGSIKVNPKTVQKAIDAEAPKEPGVIGQIAPAAGLIGGLYAAKKIASLTEGGSTEAAKQVSNSILGNSVETAGAADTTGVAANTTGSAVSGYNGILSNSAANVGPQANASFAGSQAGVEGGVTNSSINGLTQTSTMGQIGGGILGAKGVYDTIQGFQHGGEGTRTGLTEAGAGLGMAFGGPAGAAIGGLGGNIIGYGLQGNGIKNDLALAAMGPIGLPILAAKKLGFLTPHKTTRQVAQEHSQELLKQNSNDASYQSYVKGMRDQYNAAPPDPSKPYAGKYASFEEYKKAGLDANDLAGVYGNLKLGPQYTGLTQEQKANYVQTQIAKDNYKSSKGEVDFKDEQKAKQDFEAYMKGLSTGVKSSLPINVANAIQRPTPGNLPTRPAGFDVGKNGGFVRR